MQNGITIGLTQIMLLMLAGCVGVIAGAWAAIAIMRKQHNALWDALGPRRPVQESPAAPVITDMPVKEPEPSVLAVGEYNRHYSPSPGLDMLEDTLTDLRMPGTQSRDVYEHQAAMMADTTVSGTVAPEAPAAPPPSVFSVEAVLAEIGFPSREQCLAFSTGRIG